MTDAATLALDAAFGDPNTAFDAVFTPVAGDPVSCRVVVRLGDETFDAFSGGGQIVATQRADVRKSEVAAPAEGDGLAIDLDRDGTPEATYTVSSLSQPDARRLKWRLTLEEAG